MEEIKKKIDALWEDFNINYVKFHTNGNKAAGRRARVISMEITKLLKEFRAESLN